MKRRVLSFVIALALCLNLCPTWALATEGGTSGGLCPHHPAHTDECGYALEEPGAPCTFICRICPVDGLIDKLPSNVSASNSEQVQAQLSEIYALYDGLTADEQRQMDLSRCAALQEQINEMGIAAVSDDPFDIPTTVRKDVLTSDRINTSPYEVSGPWMIDTKGYTLSCANKSAIQVTSKGQLYLMGKVTSQKAIGVEVQSGGFLGVMGEDTVISGTYALDIASGANVKLASGTYTGTIAAIRAADDDFAALLVTGCAFFDTAGNPILSADAAAAKTLVVKQCTDHANRTYMTNTGTITHGWTCQACETAGTEQCTFTFDENGTGVCDLCRNEVTVAVDRESLKDLAYDSSVQPENGTVTVTVKGGGTLTKDTDYTVKYSTHANVGSTDITVKVTVTVGDGNGTFTKDYTFTENDLKESVLDWNTSVPVTLLYDGEPVEADELPKVTINIKSDVDLHQYLQYSYKAQTDSTYTDGLPTNAGTYDVVVSLPEKPVDVPDYQAASSEPVTLIIEKINPITTAPVAAMPTFNREDQELTTNGVLCAPAVKDGAQILFATEENGTYSTDIPTGFDAGTDYEVWYKVGIPADYAGNYIAVGPTQVNNVEILRKQITPAVELSQYKYLYDGGFHTPAVTVWDGKIELLNTEYMVGYIDNQNVGKAKVVVTDKTGGNYEITKVEVEFEITLREQETLSITQKPDSIIYGNRFTLSTTGGSGNGEVTWKVTDGENTVAKVDTKSGLVTIIGHGSATVQATKSGTDSQTGVTNYEDAIDTWTFTADKKAVTATVTAEDKDYNGDNAATIHAVVEQGVLPGDEITITGLEGAFSDENAGADKTVTVDVSGAAISGTNSQHYDVSYSSRTVTATIRKAVANITTPPLGATLTYNGTAQALIATGAVVDPSSVPVEYALSEDGPYSTDIPQETNAGTYTIWYRVKETQNYTGLAPASVDVTIAKKPVNPVITLSGDGLTTEADGSYSYIYDGTAKTPNVTLTEPDGTIPAKEYTVSYSDNTNAGTATVTVTAKDDGNYSFTTNLVTKNFTIKQEKAKVTTAPEPAGLPLTFSTYAQRLVTAGDGTGGTMVYFLADPDDPDNSTGTYEENIPTAINAGEYTVYYKVAGDPNHSDSDVGSVTVTIAPKPVKDPTIELKLLDDNGDPIDSYTYDGTPKKPAVTVKDGSTVIGTTDPTTGENDEYNIIYRNNVDAGDATVSITDKPGGNYTVTGSTTFVILKADIVFNPAPLAASITYDGKAHELLDPGRTSDGTVQYALNSPNASFGDAIPTATEAGNYTVYYKVIGDKNHNDLAVQSVPVTIARKPLTDIIIELDPSGFVYDGDVKMPRVTVKDGNTVLPEEEYTWTCSTATPTNKGTYTITIEGVPGGNYDLSRIDLSNRQTTFTIGQSAQAELVIDHSGAVTTYYGDTFTLSATGGSSTSAVTWSVTGTAATVDASTGEVKITGVGEVTITATNPGDQNYLPISAQWTFTAEPKPVTASVTVNNKDYDGTTDAEVVSAGIDSGDLVTGDVVTIDPASITAEFDTAFVGTEKTVTLDTSKVKVSGTNADKYAITFPATTKADISAKAVTVTVTLSDYDLNTDTSVTPNAYYYEYDGAVKTPIVTVTDENGAVIPAGEYTVDYANNKNAGTASVTVKCAEGGNYSFNDETVTFEIRPAAAKLTSTPQAKDLTYDGTNQDLVTVGVATGGTVVYSLSQIDPDDPDTYSETISRGQNAGVYTVYYMVKGDANHDDTTPGQVSVTIKPKEITPKITLGTSSYVYSGSECKPTVTVEDGTDTISAGEYTVSYRDNINAGTATVIVSDNNGGDYIVNGTATFTIEKAAPTVTNPTGKPGLQYNGELQELVTAGVTSHGTVVYSLDGGNYSSAIPTASAVGMYTIMYKVLGDENHNDTTPKTLKGVEIARNTVNKPTISLSQDTFQYNGSQQKPVITVYDDNSREIPAHEYTVKIEGTGGNNGMVNVDTYTVTVETPSTSNYVIKDDGNGSNTRIFTIVPANQETISITGAQAQVHYGDVIQLGTTGGIGGGQVTWTVTNAKGDPVSSTISTTGLLTVKDVGGPITVTATCSAGGNYKDVSATWEFSASKKQVMAVVTVADKLYDGNANVAAVDITAKVNASDLVTGDSITITGLSATFDNASAGTNKKVTINSSSVSVIGTNADKYDITYPATTTASILAAAATVASGDEPKAVPSLTYDASQSQALVTAGTATGGTMVYSLDGTNFTPAIPKAKDAGDYTVYFKARGDGNHTDSAVGTVTVTIDKQTMTPAIELNPPTAPYDGQVKRPEVTVLDGDNNVIPASEYKVTYVTDNGENWIDKDTYTVKVENINGGNYVVNDAQETFTISKTAQNPLEIVNKPGLVYYGDTFTLSATGGSGSGAVTWSVDNESVVKIDGNGLVEIVGKGQATITATRPGGGNYDDATATYSLNALAKPITAIVTADDKVYDGVIPAKATLHITWKEGALVGTDSLNTTQIEGTFENENVGTNKTVNISGTVVNDATAQKYDITIPATTTASILKANATAPSVSANDRMYDGTPKALVTGGDTNTLYSDSRDGVYSATVPTGTNAGTYTVWYKAKGDSNHNDSELQSIQVTISRKTLMVSNTNATLSGSDLQTDTDGTYYYEYDGTEKTPSVIISDGAATVPASEYTVSYSGNKNVGTAATVTITNVEGGNYDVSGIVTFEIREGTALLTGSPKANDLTYTGQAQELVTVGTASGGHIEYALDGVDKGENIPTAINAGIYVVSYKVVGDGNHADGPTGSVTVTIKPKEIVSPKVTVNGTYTYDGSPQVPGAADITVEDGGVTIGNTEYNVTFRDNTDAGTATVVITNANGGNYIVNGTGTFTIGKAELAAGDITAPTGLENLPYNGTAQVLITAGTATGGTMVYSLSQTGEYSAAIPTETAVGNYKVWYKVLGDSNHNDTTPASVDASIIVNTVSNPTIQVEPATVKYTGEKQVPTVTVKDDNGVLIDGSEYEVTYEDTTNNNADLTSVGKYTVIITGVSGGNYTFEATDGKNTATFEILYADQEALTITGTRERVYYGDTIQLGTTGGNGTVTWKVDDGSTVATIDGSGLLKITGVGSVTVTATSTAPGYTPQTATWRFYADPKPVTAVVTAESKDYDGEKETTVTAALQASDLVGTDDIKITLSGEFEDPSAGTDKKVKVDSTSPKFDGSTGDPENYNITYPAAATASIRKADIDETKDVTAPTAADAADLVYSGSPLALVKAGSAEGGTMEYSTDGINYSASLPTGTNAGNYDVWYRVKGDSNHNDVDAVKLSSQVTITKQTVDTPKIEFTPSGASYDGQEHKPTVTVKDANGRTIPAAEYTVDYGSTNWRDVGPHKVKVTAKGDGNYTFAEAEETFTILPAGQSPLSIVGKPANVQYGDVFTLSTLGGSGDGVVTWETSDTSVIAIDQLSGKVRVLKSGGPVTITARKQAGGGYGETTATWTFSAEKKAVTPVITAKDKEYDGNDTAVLVITWKDGDLVGSDTITLNLTGVFDNANVGTGKTVRITLNGALPDDGKYAVTIPATTTASITPKAATVDSIVLPTDLKYTGSAQRLVSSSLATGGDVVYSTNGVTFTRTVPTGTNAGSYTFWYKALADKNYEDSPVAEATVTIAPKPVNAPTIELDPDTFEYDGTAKKPDVTVKDGSVIIPASEYTVSYSNNTAVSTDTAPAKVTISDVPGGNYTVNGSETFTITAGDAKLTGAPQAKALTYNGNPQELVTDGTAVNGQVVYSLTGNDDYTPTVPTGINTGTYSVYYKVKGANGAADTAARVVYVTIQPKPVNNPEILLDLEEDTVPYTGAAYRPDVVAVVDGNKPIPPTEYTVTYRNNTKVGTATVYVISKSNSNYSIYATTTFEIVKAAAKFTANPTAKTGLAYNGTAQELVEAGTVDGGTAFYSLDGVTYSGVIPTGTETRKYTVFAKVVGDSTHADSDPVTITAEIKPNKPTDPKIVLSGSSFSYTGGEIKPTVTVYDDSNKVIPATEYTVSYSNNTNVGTNATVTVTGSGKNYGFTATAKFEIVNVGQPQLEITGKKDAVYYGDTLSLGTTGGSGSSAVSWTVSGPADKLSDGQFKITGSGMVTITATKAASTGYAEATATWTFPAKARPVTALVTAADKDYDGKTDATLSVAYDGLMSGEDISSGVTATGQFTDERVGTGKTVIVTLTISTDISKKYEISYPKTITASITQAPPEVTAPTVAGPLTYNGAEQALLTGEGSATGGNLMYSLDGGITYSYTAPKAKDAGGYDVWYKVVASDDNYKDSAPAKVGTVTIAQNTEKPSNAACSPDTVQYSGTAQTPAVVVLDNTGRPIPAEEYTVTVVGGPAIDPGTYTVNVKDIKGGNYEFTETLTASFEIVAVSQNPLSITDKPASVHYGDKFILSAIGGSGSGNVVWSITGSSGVATVKDGVVTVTGTGTFTVEAYRAAWGGYGKSNTDSVTFYADPKPITPVVTAANKSYDGNTTATLTAKFKDGDLVGSDTITLTVGTGTFETPDVGTNKKVSIVPGTANGDTGNYVITWPESTTANISRVNAQWVQEPKEVDNLTYTGNPQALLTPGTTLNGIGKVEYSTSQYGGYSANIPTGTKAGTYTVWYRVADDVNYQGIAAASIEVEIKKADPVISTQPTATGTAGQKLSEIKLNGGATDTAGKFAWEDGDVEVASGTKYNVIFTPDDTANYETKTIQVTVTSDADSAIPSIAPIVIDDAAAGSGAVQTTVQNGTASTVVSAAAGSKLVQEAVENQSESIVIKPEVTGEVTRTEVSIPASTVSQIKNETNAALTVSAPIADVTIPNAALDTLGSAGGTINVATEQVDQAVVLTVTAGGEPVDSIPGGVTLTVPAEDAGPGTVAVLVHEDGTRETVQKSMVEDGKLSIPLSGSATVEIVDNSKAFADVQSTDWAVDAVAFASARELFSGTSETTFSPNQAMSRGMLATVLYRLEGSPDQDGATTYGDVSSDAWYADGVAWAVENGIASGYGDGRFGPNDSITREQFAVMLWNYAGQPAANGQALDFTDADQISGYALEALCWAVENGIMNGYGNGQLVPGGTATRAQAAQMLKNYMENT